MQIYLACISFIVFVSHRLSQEPKIADPETTGRIHHQEPEITDANYYNVTNANSLTIADFLQLAKFEPRKAKTNNINPPETAKQNPLRAKTANSASLSEPRIANTSAALLSRLGDPIG